MTEQKLAMVELFVLIDDDSNWECGESVEKAIERFIDNVGTLDESEGFRIVKVKLSVPVPVIAEVSGIAPAVGEPMIMEVESA